MKTKKIIKFKHLSKKNSKPCAARITHLQSLRLAYYWIEKKRLILEVELIVVWGAVIGLRI